MSNPTYQQVRRAPLLTPRQVFEQVQEQGDDLILLDVRLPQEWMADGIIDAAIRIPMHELPSRVDSLPTDKAIIVTCAHGLRSATVGVWLLEQGYEVYDMQGGLALWKYQGLPLHSIRPEHDAPSG